VNITGIKRLWIVSLSLQLVFLFSSMFILDFGRTSKVLLAFILVWNAALLSGIVVLSMDDRKIFGLRISVTLGVLMSLLLYVFAAQCRHRLKTHVGSIEHAPSQFNPR
jgi:glucose-6-phosphate-specific signal transduction histidine kinase